MSRLVNITVAVCVAIIMSVFAWYQGVKQGVRAGIMEARMEIFIKVNEIDKENEDRMIYMDGAIFLMARKNNGKVTMRLETK